MTAMKRRVNIVEEVPDVAHHDAADLILGHDAVDDQAECHQHPREIWGREDQHAKEAKASVGVSAAPDVDQAR